MTPAPGPSVFHITHVDNLASIVAGGGLHCDAAMSTRGGPTAAIGMNAIKSRRMRLPVKCHPGDFVGEYVPFYFCPRSVMLYILRQGNHPEITYRGGQGPILHLEANLLEVVHWAEAEGRRWAFTLSNAGAAYTEFRASLDHLDEIDWEAVETGDFRESRVKEGKQAEFLVQAFVPWHLVRRIGVSSARVSDQVTTILAGSEHRPVVTVRPDWYF